MFTSIVKKSAAVVSVLVLASGVANAAVDVAVTTAITSSGTDSATIGSAVLVVLVGIASFKYMRRAL
jgi:hypothetical protein